MWPWAHVAFAYLLLAGVCRFRWNHRPASTEALAVGFGAMIPDLIDKPLAWRLDVLPYGRTLAHSLLIGGGTLVVVGIVARRYGHERGFDAFAIGFLSHLVGDAYQPALVGNWSDLFFLTWPLTAAPDSGETVGIVAQFQQLEFTPLFLLGVAITAGGIAVWSAQGRPGVDTVKGWLQAPVSG